MAREKKVLLTAQEAFDKALEQGGFLAGQDGQYFAMVGYQKEDGTHDGPMFISCDGGMAIEIDREGKFVNAYTAKLDRFFPWMSLESVRGQK